jgi:hypothetical protein
MESRVAHLREPLEATALDMHIEATMSLKSGVEKLDVRSSFAILENVNESVSALQKLVDHLSTLQDTFDRLSEAQRRDWVISAKSDRVHYVRQTLYRHLSKVKGTGSDTTLVKQIAAVFRLTCSKPFSVSSRMSSVEYMNERDNAAANTDKIRVEAEDSLSNSKTASLEIPRYYKGNGMKFALALVRELGLEGILVPISSGDNGQPSKRLAQAEHYDFREINRVHGMQRQYVSDTRLLNKIGDIWMNEGKRGLKDKLSSTKSSTM